MSEDGENIPPSQHFMVTTEAMSSYNHGTSMKQEGDRTSSPVVVQSTPMHDYVASPVATSHSSTSSPLSSEHHYNHHPHHHLAPSSRTQPAGVPGHSIPVPVRSASWVAGSPEPVNANVPAVITTKAGSTPNFAAQTAKPQNPNNTAKSAAKTVKSVQVPAKKKQNAKNEKKTGDTVTARRQKRLERNRESARLSRRRRKQYLEVLEDRVKQLSIEMDSGRRQHTAVAIETIKNKRRDVLNGNPNEQELALLDGPLSRSSNELSVLSTFNTQQLKSFSLPADSKFVLWLTLQGDTYFRGGRAASERLSAARIGERMLHSGNDRAAPINPMWPLLCNEVGLSYDQEERVRNYQRTMLQDSNTWLDRHSARSSSLAMQSFHDGLKAVASVASQRESRTKPLLSSDQRLRFLAWADKNADRIKAKFGKARENLGKPKESDKFQYSESQHLAANLYILNDRLQKVMAHFPQSFPLTTPAALKRLSRRPSFESLGQQKEDAGKALSRDGSFASSENLKRSGSSLSIDDEDKPQPQQVSPEDGEEAATSTIEKELGFVKEIIPKYVPPVPPPAPSAPTAVPSAPVQVYQYTATPVAPSGALQAPQNHMRRGVTTHPTPIAAHPPHGAHHIHPAPVPRETYSQAPPHYQQAYSHPQQTQYYQQYPGQPPQSYGHPPGVHHYMQLQPQALAPAPPQVTSQPAPAPPLRVPPQLAPAPPPAAAPSPGPVAAPAPAPIHQRKSSFLPPHLNVVPEEMFPATDGAEDFFMSLMDDEDWAIGEGVDMDTSHT